MAQKGKRELYAELEPSLDDNKSDFCIFILPHNDPVVRPSVETVLVVVICRWVTYFR